MHDDDLAMMVVSFSPLLFSRIMKGGNPLVHNGSQHAWYTGVAKGGRPSSTGQPSTPRRPTRRSPDRRARPISETRAQAGAQPPVNHNRWGTPHRLGMVVGEAEDKKKA